MKTIQEYFSIYKQSAWTKDSERMISLYDDNVVIFDMWRQGFQTGVAEWSVAIKNWLNSLGEERVNVIFEMIELHEADNVAFGSALITFQAISPDNAVNRSMKNRITLGFIRKEQQWKVIHQHTSAPVNTDLQAILN
jgi:ketosteroid isomerase-like protein